MAREFAKDFYKSKEWQKIREAILMRDRYLCVKCGAPAEEVHHKKHLTPQNIYDPKITMNPENLVSLCKACHFEEHRGQHGNGRIAAEKEDDYPYQFDECGMLIKKPNPPVSVST